MAFPTFVHSHGPPQGIFLIFFQHNVVGVVLDVVLVPSSAPGGRTWAFLGPYMSQIGLGVP